MDSAMLAPPGVGSWTDTSLCNCKDSGVLKQFIRAGGYLSNLWGEIVEMYSPVYKISVAYLAGYNTIYFYVY